MLIVSASKLTPRFILSSRPTTSKASAKPGKNADGTFENWFQYNDRGRGDSLRTIYREDEEGYPTYIKASGVDYMKNHVFEEFNLNNNIATWKNPVVKDETKTIQGKMFYVGLKTEAGHQLKAFHANGNKLKLLPYGELENESP